MHVGLKARGAWVSGHIVGSIPLEEAMLSGYFLDERGKNEGSQVVGAKDASQSEISTSRG